MSHFFFSLSHTLTVFLSISSDCTSWSSHLCFSRMAEWLSVFCFSSEQGRMALAFFFFCSFPSTCPTRLGHFSINEKANFEDFWNKLINELDKYVWWNPRVSHAPNIVIVCHLSIIRAFTAVELKSYNAILAPPIYKKSSTAVEAKQNFFCWFATVHIYLLMCIVALI